MLTSIYEAIEAGNPRSMMIEESRLRAHKIYGTAATLGFVELGERARKVELGAVEYLEKGVLIGSPDTFKHELGQLLLEIYHAHTG